MEVHTCTSSCKYNQRSCEAPAPVTFWPGTTWQLQIITKSAIEYDPKKIKRKNKNNIFFRLLQESSDHEKITSIPSLRGSFEIIAWHANNLYPGLQSFWHVHWNVPRCAEAEEIIFNTFKLPFGLRKATSLPPFHGSTF